MQALQQGRAALEAELEASRAEASTAAAERDNLSEQLHESQTSLLQVSTCTCAQPRHKLNLHSSSPGILCQSVGRVALRCM